MTITALTFEETAFNSQKKLLITLIESSLSDADVFDLYEESGSLTRFKSKFFGYILSSLSVWHSDSFQHKYFSNLQMLLRLQFFDAFSPVIPFSEFLPFFLEEAKK